MTLREAALAAADAGYFIFPCTPGAKTPAVDAWQRAATTDLARIETWWTENPAYNIGVVPGMSGMFVLDQDGPEGSEALAKLTKDHGPLPDTLTIRTPSGPSNLHYWFAGECRNTVGTLGAKLDTRGRSPGNKYGYVLLPPSVTDKGEYQYANDTDIADAPAWISDTLGTQEAQAATNVTLDAPQNISRAQQLLADYVRGEHVAMEGSGGDNRTYAVAAEVLNHGLSPAKAFELLRDEWNPHCVPPWTEEELAIKIANAAEYAQNEAGAWAVPDAAETFKHIISAAQSASKDRKPDPWRLYTLGDRAEFREPDWLIPGLIPAHGTVQIIGRQKSFKTFLTLHMVMALAAGVEVCGFKPLAPSRVLYAVGENADTMMLKHTAAWQSAHGVADDLPFRLVRRVPVAMRPEDAHALILSARPFAPNIVVLDPMTRAMRGLDENLARDMGAFSDMVEFLQRELDATIIVIRHTGKDAARGGRGSNVAECDFDTTLTVERHEKSQYVALNVTEQRNAEERREPFCFEMRRHDPSAVLSETSYDVYRNALRADNPYAPEKIVAALHDLGAVHGKTVETHVLASHVLARLPADTSKTEAELLQGAVRGLSTLAKGNLGRYTSGSGRGLRWGMPHLDDDVPS